MEQMEGRPVGRLLWQFKGGMMVAGPEVVTR